MKICPTCQYHNREGVIFCDDCGESLIGIPSVRTRTLALEEEEKDLPEPIKIDLTSSSSHFSLNADLLVRLTSASRPLMLKVEKLLTVGRLDSTTKVTPDLDLTPFGANEKGVSRMHATLHRNGESLLIVDMNSANGTYVNGTRLQSGQPRILRDGDEIRLGKLEMRLYFTKAGSLIG